MFEAKPLWVKLIADNCITSPGTWAGQTLHSMHSLASGTGIGMHLSSKRAKLLYSQCSTSFVLRNNDRFKIILLNAILILGIVCNFQVGIYCHLLTIKIFIKQMQTILWELTVSLFINITFTIYMWHWLAKQTQLLVMLNSLASEMGINLIKQQAYNYKPSTVKKKKKEYRLL